MTRWLALVSSELRQRRLLLAGSALLGLLALAAPALPVLTAYDPAEIRSATALFVCVLWTPLLALVAGSTALGGELADRRIGFYLTRPLSIWTVWGGKLGAAMLLPLLAGFLILLPAALAGGAFAAAGSPIAGFADLPFPRWWVATLGLLALVALGHAAGIALRSRSGWLLLDLAAIAVGAALVVEAVRTLDRAFAPQATAAGATGLTAFAVAALLAAGAVALHRGRAELRAAHRALSLALWPVLLAGAFGFVLFARWVISAPIDSLIGGGTAWALPGAGSWVMVHGEAAHRFGSWSAFLLETGSGRAVRLGPSLGGLPVAADGSRAVWLGFEGSVWQLWSLDLREREALPRRTTISLAGWPLQLALSPRGGRLAALGDDRLLVYGLAGEKLLVTAPVEAPSAAAQLVFLDEERLRVVLRRREGRLAWLEVQDLAAGARRLAPGARIEPPDLGAWRLGPGGDRLLVESTARFFGSSKPPRIYDPATGRLVAELAGSPVPSAAFLADGSIALRQPAAGGETLRIVSRDGIEQRAFSFPGARALDLGGQPGPGELVAAAAACGTRKRAGCWTAYRLDLASGARRRLGKLQPLADPPASGAAANLFRTAGAPLVEVGAGGARRVILPRPR